MTEVIGLDWSFPKRRQEQRYPATSVRGGEDRRQLVQSNLRRGAKELQMIAQQIRRRLAGVVAVIAVAAATGLRADRVPGPHGLETITPNNWTLTPAGTQIPMCDRPMDAALSPDGRYLVVSNNGQGTQSLVLVHTASRAVL